MPYDYAIDFRTGDWQFTAGRDFQIVAGEGLIQQRASVRLRIPRGQYQYDETGTLGSQLHLTKRYQIDRALDEIPAIVQEALDPMEDLTVLEITAEQDRADPNVKGDRADPTRINTSIRYTTTLFTGDDETSDDVDTDEEIMDFQL